MSGTVATIARTLGRGVFPHQFSWLIDNAARRLIISPRAIADRMSLSPSSRVLEIGPGSGYFSIELAKRLPNGLLALLDLQPEMLAKARRKLAGAHSTRIVYAAADAGSNLPFGDAQFDRVLLVSVLGEVSNQAGCIRAMHRVLRPRGIAVFHESIPDPDLIRLERLLNLVTPAGFRFVGKWGPSWNYTAAFEKTAEG
jgi:uncharacterized protein